MVAGGLRDRAERRPHPKTRGRRLALPALGALAAEPLYVLVDTAIVGHLGRPQIAALGLAGTLLAGTFTIFNFLTYGTTAVVARASGAGHDRAAAGLAAQALWVALAIGLALVVVAANVVNLVLELVFVYGFRWGIAGSAATAAPGITRSSTCGSPPSACRRRSWRSRGRDISAASRTSAGRSGS